MRPLRFFVLALLGLWSSFVLAEVPVRVLLGEVAGAVEVRMQGAHRGYLDARAAFETSYALTWPLQARGDLLYLDGRAVGQSLTLEPLDGSFIGWQGQAYRGGLRLTASGGRILIVNVLDLEAYLRGVAPAEMPANWPLEALRAQAVAARTYTLAELEPEALYDICATVECQHYAGVEAEHPRSDQAIAETKGQVLTYAGVVATTYYHADSGGMLASSAEVWGEAEPYLVARPDVERNSPHKNWELGLEPETVAADLRARGRDIGTVTGLRVLAYSESGRVTMAEFQGTKGVAVLSAQALTELLRDAGLKSTRFKMVGGLVAEGQGWGHGVGMSQYGARALAEAGYNYAQILAFYYPSTAFANVAGLRAQQLAVSVAWEKQNRVSGAPSLRPANESRSILALLALSLSE